MSDSKNPPSTLESQRQLVKLAVADFDKFRIADNSAFLQMIAETKAASMSMAETLARLRPQFDDLFPLGRLQKTLAAFQFEMPKIPEAHVTALTAWRAEFDGLTATVSKQLEQQANLFLGLEAGRKFQEMFAEPLGHLKAAEQVNIDLPRLALQNWLPEVAFQRSSLLEDALRNVTALQELYSTAALSTIHIPSVEYIEVATHLVWKHGNFVRRLPPALPEAPSREHQHQEIGPQLEARLLRVDPQLEELRRQAWKNLTGGKPGALLAAHGMREVLAKLLHIFAPDEEVKKSDSWLQRKEQALLKPTRRMRFEYIVGAGAADLAAFIQFNDSVERGQKFAHTFADDVEVVRTHLAQLEACIYLLVIHATERKGRT
jgi:hypothetical protein